MIKEKTTTNYYKISTLLLGISLIFMFRSGDKFFLLSNYYYFAVISLMLLFLETIMIDKVVFGKISKLILALCVISIVSCLVADRYINMSFVFSYIIWLGLFLLISVNTYTKKEINYLCNCYILGALIITFLIFKQNVNYESFSSRLTIQLKNGDLADPNMLALFLVVPCILSLINVLCVKNKSLKIVYCISSIAIILGIFFTGSRGSIIAIMIGLTFVFYEFYLKENPNALELTLKAVALLFIAIVLLLIIKFYLPQDVYKRIFISSYNDMSNQIRIERWRYGMMAMKEAPIFGYGFQDNLDVLERVVGVYSSPHNSFIVIWMEFGTIGLVLLFALMGYYLYQFKIMGHWSCFGLLIGLIICFFLVDATLSYMFWFNLILLAIFINYCKKNNVAFMEMFRD
ncbi:O-antigen ligase family protein [Eubacterium callanderi]|uniref:O-antigen ligase family protein n=2 Tax=Eubacterium callanderi TaxID=53442 RepID=UPI001C2D6565|nr:O-antigen ligase family protein [Eubacterium callanderi]MBV1681863.1 O-antigen ligase family protein [Eubacterium callanderi]